jgi:hypothetical protein
MDRLQSRNTKRYEVKLLFEKTCGNKYEASADSNSETRAALAAVKFILATDFQRS